MSNYVIVDYRIQESSIKNLKSYFDKIVFTKPLNTMKSINGHADIGICKITDNEIVVCPSEFEYLKTELPDIKVISGSSEPSEKYPLDVFYNAACYNDIAVHNFRYTDKITLAVIEQKFSKRINVHQGYSKCNICFVNNGGMITEDEGIYKILKINGFDVLKISAGDVKLESMNYGFFGGASGLFHDTLFLNGELKRHRDSQRIITYLEKHNTKLIELNKGDIIDVGSIICLGKQKYYFNSVK